LTSQKRLAIVALISQDVHQRDIVDLLLKKALQSGGIKEGDYLWQQQLRYYSSPNDEVSVL